ncbi:MAG: hypothetical protein WBB67_11900 [bacterium]
MRDDIINSEMKLSVILRKAKVLASILKNEELKRWVDYEINGYPSAKDVPDYRRSVTQSYGYFAGPFGSAIKNVPIPTVNLSESIREFAGNICHVEGIRGLESLLDDNSPSFSIQWPADILPLIQDEIYVGYNCISAWRVIGRSQIEQILDTVRNRLLNFILELEEKYPDIDEKEEAIANLPKDQVSSVVNTYVLGNQNVVASGQYANQTVIQNIVEKDLNSLLNYMKKIGVPGENIVELKNAIDADGMRDEKNKFGPKIMTWIGNMTTKILEGAWKVAISTAPSLLIKALSRYYGWE